MYTFFFFILTKTKKKDFSLFLWKSKFIFCTWKQNHYLWGVMIQPAGADMNSGCLMETECINGSQNTENHFWLWLKADSLMWTVVTSERAVNPALSLLKTASLHFHIYPPKNSYLHSLCTCCQAIKHIYLYRFNSLVNCLFRLILNQLIRVHKYLLNFVQQFTKKCVALLMNIQPIFIL